MYHPRIWIDALTGEESIFLCRLAVFQGHPVSPQRQCPATSIDQHASIESVPRAHVRPGLACALNRNLAKRASFKEMRHLVTEIENMTVCASLLIRDYVSS